MITLSYTNLSSIPVEAWLALLNEPKVREHLIEHPPFTPATVAQWVLEKQRVNAEPGCRVNAIVCEGVLAGWCGIQYEDGDYEMAIVLDPSQWGLGPRIFADMIGWAVALGHSTLLIHFHHTRKAYSFLRKVATAVYPSRLLGSEFLTYELSVPVLAEKYQPYN